MGLSLVGLEASRSFKAAKASSCRLVHTSIRSSEPWGVCVMVRFW